MPRRNNRPQVDSGKEKKALSRWMRFCEMTIAENKQPQRVAFTSEKGAGKGAVN